MSKPWKVELQPFAEQYATVIGSIDEHVTKLDDAELARLLSDTQRPNRSNCWWATYAVAPVIRDQCRGEQLRRQAARERVASAGVSTEPRKD